jgi:hypothetical protein
MPYFDVIFFFEPTIFCERSYEAMEEEKRFPVRLPHKLYSALFFAADRHKTSMNRFLSDLIDENLSAATPAATLFVKNPFQAQREKTQISVRIPASLHNAFQKHCIDVNSNMTSMLTQWLLLVPEIRDRLWSHHRFAVKL